MCVYVYACICVQTFINTQIETKNWTRQCLGNMIGQWSFETNSPYEKEWYWGKHEQNR